ncbi:MAG: hypothetical protein EOO21_00775 [Comamonadaceae bacterium]|nr:MAG: hypothetical protein EOO21_00775 [Comamonadaceae bacterium]
MRDHPNFVFIFAEDLGYAGLSCYGRRDAAFGKVSPVLDRQDSGDLRLSDGYANSPICSPTRFAIITGRWQYQLRGAAEEPGRHHVGSVGAPADPAFYSCVTPTTTPR